MEQNDKYLIRTLGAGVAAVLLVWTIVTEAPDYGWLYNWQTLIAGVLALAGAAIVLVSVRMQIASDRVLAEDAKRDRANAARVRLVQYLESSAERFEKIIWRIEEWNNNPGRDSFPPPSDIIGIPKLILPEMTDLPLAEAEELTHFQQDIDRVIELISFSANHGHLEDALSLTRLHAADKTLKLIEWRNRVGNVIYWKPMSILGERIEILENALTEEQRYQDVMAGNATAPTPEDG